MTENTLYQAFDLQRFVGNERLQNVIKKSHARMAARELSDDDLDLVTAAGTPEMLGLFGGEGSEDKDEPWDPR